MIPTNLFPHTRIKWTLCVRRNGQRPDGDGAGAVAPDGHAARVSTERGNVLGNEAQPCGQVPEAQVAGQLGVARRGETFLFFDWKKIGRK